MDKFFRWLTGNKQTTTNPAQDVANTAPLSEQQIQAIVSNQNPRFDLQQLIASCGQSVGKQRELNEDSLLAMTATMAGNSGNLTLWSLHCCRWDGWAPVWRSCQQCRDPHGGWIYFAQVPSVSLSYQIGYDG